MSSNRLDRSLAIIRASEIGQYAFCSKAWQLQQEGCASDSRDIERGAKAHRSLGYTLDSFDHSVHLSQLCIKIGLIFFGIGIMILLGWLFL
jgi:hypothetical protein